MIYLYHGSNVKIETIDLKKSINIILCYGENLHEIFAICFSVLSPKIYIGSVDKYWGALKQKHKNRSPLAKNQTR